MMVKQKMFEIQLNSIKSISKKTMIIPFSQTPEPEIQPVLPMFALPNAPNNINAHLIEQFSERYRQDRSKPPRNKANSVVSSNRLNKRHTQEGISQLLELPLPFRVDNTFMGKGDSNSFLMKSKFPVSKAYKKLPKIPKASSIEQAIVDAKMQFVKQKVKGKETEQIISMNLMVESKAIELRTHIQEQIDILSPKMPEKSLLRPSIPNHPLLPLYRSCLSKQSVKKDLIDIMDTRDSLTKQQPQIIRPKYKKGYLIYDPNCWNYIKNRQQTTSLLSTLPPKSSAVSARDYCILDFQTLQPLHIHKTAKGSIQIASLTKIVTCLLTILACKKYQIDFQYKCRVSEQAAEMMGTSAELQAGDSLTIEQLLHALMLPSGNDAAVALAEVMGRIIQRKKKMQAIIDPQVTFVRQMNVLYKQLIEDDKDKLHVFKNPSGLMVNPNTTTVEQITIFASVACKNEEFQKIINTKSYKLTINNERYGISRKMQWKNTNKLLWKGWEGVKTGTTENAGHCFVGKFQNYIFTLLDCKSLEARFMDAEVLRKWLMPE